MGMGLRGAGREQQRAAVDGRAMVTTVMRVCGESAVGAARYRRSLQAAWEVRQPELVRAPDRDGHDVARCRPPAARQALGTRRVGDGRPIASCPMYAAHDRLSEDGLYMDVTAGSLHTGFRSSLAAGGHGDTLHGHAGRGQLPACARALPARRAAVHG